MKACSNSLDTSNANYFRVLLQRTLAKIIIFLVSVKLEVIRYNTSCMHICMEICMYVYEDKRRERKGGYEREGGRKGGRGERRGGKGNSLVDKHRR